MGIAEIKQNTKKQTNKCWWGGRVIGTWCIISKNGAAAGETSVEFPQNEKKKREKKENKMNS